MKKINEEAIKLVIEESKYNKRNNYKNGGPFGAAIVFGDKIIASAHNSVIESVDPTAYAEINVIRKASQILNTGDLSGCILYTSTEPCPMCLSAIIWSNIKEVYYLNTKEDADEIKFRDKQIYDYIRGENNILNMHHIESIEAKKVFDKFEEITDKNMY